MWNWDGWKIDLSAIYYAAKSYGAGHLDLIYDATERVVYNTPPQLWADWAAADGWDVKEIVFTPYLYPPLWAALLAPVAGRMDVETFYNVGLVANVAASVWMVWLGWQLVQPRRVIPLVWAVLGFGLLLITVVGYMIYWLGQPQVIVSALMLGSAVALSRGREVNAGLLLGLATALKLSPLLLAVLFVMEKRWKALAVFAASGFVFGVVSLSVVGWPLHAELLQKLQLVEERVLISRIIVSLETVLFQLQEVVRGTADWTIAEPRQAMEPGWIAWVVRATMLGLMGLTYWVTRDRPARTRIWMRFYLLVLVTLITNPLGWIHYMVLPFALLPAFYELYDKVRTTAIVLAIGLLYSMPIFIEAVLFDYTGFMQIGVWISGCLVMIGMLVFARPVEQAAE
nr:glycosyltransferase family 87 protein [Maritimibacter sp. DP1N21-5]